MSVRRGDKSDEAGKIPDCVSITRILVECLLGLVAEEWKFERKQISQEQI